jgi:hypothetical protein
MGKSKEELRSDVRFLEWHNESREVDEDRLYDMSRDELEDYKDDLLMGRR